MRRRAAGLATSIAVLLTLWLIWSKIHIVLWVQIPWWMFAILAFVLFLAIEHVLSSLFNRNGS